MLKSTLDLANIAVTLVKHGLTEQEAQTAIEHAVVENEGVRPLWVRIDDFERWANSRDDDALLWGLFTWTSTPEGFSHWYDLADKVDASVRAELGLID